MDPTPTPAAWTSKLGWLRALLMEASRRGVTHLEAHVLTIIATRSGPHGRCYAGATRLAGDCGLTARSRRLYDAIRRLRDLGLLDVETRRINARRTQNVGYRFVRGRLVPDEREREIVARIRKMRSRGMSYARIAAKLNETVPPRKGTKCWHAASIWDAVRAP